MSSSRSSTLNILIVEDAIGIADTYKKLLGEEYSVKVCTSGKDVQTLIDDKCEFDLTIVDIVLPPEDGERYKLEDCQETGLRLIESLIECNLCRRFYVITVAKHLKDRVEELCKNNEVVLKFEYKLDHEPEKLVDNVRDILAIAIPE